MKTYKMKDVPVFECCFFEKFPGTQDPDFDWGDENADVVYFCHMAGDESDKYTDACKGDHSKCPIAFGRAKIISRLMV
jgi:hypothetical protein